MAADAPSRDAATRALIHRARAAFDAGDYERALERATVAYGLVPAPTLALLEARALLRLGRWLEARNRYRIAARALPPNAPRAYADARQRALAELEELRHKLPQLRLLVAPADTPLEQLRLELDGLPVPAELVGLQTPRDPGEHVLRYWIDGSQRQQRFTLRPESSHVVVLEVPARPKLPSRQEVLATASEQPPDGDAAWEPYAAWGALGVGAASATAGVLLGTHSMRLRSGLESRCEEELCTADAKEAVSRYRRARDLSTAGYLVGLTAIATGGVLLWHSESEGRRTELSVGMARCDVRGTF